MLKVGWKVAPLKSSFMLASILGFLITMIYTVYGRISMDWGVAIGIVFFLMFIASLISMTRAPIEMQLEMAPDLFPQQKKKARKRRSAKKPAKKKPAKKKAKSKKSKKK
jgi:hypothetical protein